MNKYKKLIFEEMKEAGFDAMLNRTSANIEWALLYYEDYHFLLGLIRKARRVTQ